MVARILPRCLDRNNRGVERPDIRALRWSRFPQLHIRITASVCTMAVFACVHQNLRARSIAGKRRAQMEKRSAPQRNKRCHSTRNNAMGHLQSIFHETNRVPSTTRFGMFSPRMFSGKGPSVSSAKSSGPRALDILRRLPSGRRHVVQDRILHILTPSWPNPSSPDRGPSSPHTLTGSA